MMEKLFYTSGNTALKKGVMVDGNNFSIKESVELLQVKKKKPCEEGGMGSHMQRICSVNSTQH